MLTVAAVRASRGGVASIKLAELVDEFPHHWRYATRFERLDVVPAGVTGRKDDSGKLDYTLLDDMPRAIAAVVEVMQWAVTKKQPVPYERGSWLGVSADRYRAALARHNADACKIAGEAGAPRFTCDSETKLLHLAHQACSALMALENTLRELEDAQRKAANKS